ncbi:hypothetical protein IWQ61_000414 [Dispira simplex]|nr:hypothetical protein IWQ61_000414 [Dispira simplex]
MLLYSMPRTALRATWPSLWSRLFDKSKSGRANTPRSSANQTDDTPKAQERKSHHDQLLYNRIHHHLNQQLQKRSHQNEQLYVSALQNTLQGVHSLLDQDRRQTVLDVVRQCTDSGRWATFDKLVRRDMVPGYWLDNPWMAQTVFKVLLYRGENKQVLSLFWQLWQRRPVAQFTANHFYWALLAAIHVDTESTRRLSDHQSDITAVAERTSPTKTSPSAFPKATELYALIAQFQHQPTTLVQYSIILRYHILTNEYVAVVNTWKAMVRFGCPLDPVYFLHFLNYLVGVHKQVDVAVAYFRSDAPQILFSLQTDGMFTPPAPPSPTSVDSPGRTNILLDRTQPIQFTDSMYQPLPSPHASHSVPITLDRRPLLGIVDQFLCQGYPWEAHQLLTYLFRLINDSLVSTERSPAPDSSFHQIHGRQQASSIPKSKPNPSPIGPLTSVPVWPTTFTLLLPNSNGTSQLPTLTTRLTRALIQKKRWLALLNLVNWLDYWDLPTDPLCTRYLTQEHPLSLENAVGDSRTCWQLKSVYRHQSKESHPSGFTEL